MLKTVKKCECSNSANKEIKWIVDQVFITLKCNKCGLSVTRSGKSINYNDILLNTIMVWNKFDDYEGNGNEETVCEIDN